jgi:membrane protease YdiL (CAAX protease family)
MRSRLAWEGISREVVKTASFQEEGEGVSCEHLYPIEEIATMNKISQFPLARIVIATLFVGVGVATGQVILNLLRAAFSITDTSVSNLLAFLLVTPAAYSAYWRYVHSVEKRDLTELRGANAFKEFGLGSLTGFGLFGFVVATLCLLGFYRVTGSTFVLLSLVGALAGAFVSAFAQELVFRAILYRITEEWLGTWWAVAISAILFGLIHLSSAGATIFSAFAVALQAGILLAAAYALTHRLWVALGLHAFWDFANDGVFGVGVAGQSGQALHALLQASLKGPDLFTGGALGVEASLITVVIVATVGVFMLWKARQRGLVISRTK